ncbi:TPA: hypothetical protein ACSVA4_004947 [Escherichia coli]
MSVLADGVLVAGGW